MSSRVGRAGEPLVAGSREQIGVQCAIARSDAFDIVAWTGAQDVWRVEVKTSANFDLQRPNTFHFKTRTGRDRRPLSHCDVVAFVALNLRRVHFRHIDAVRGTSTRVASTVFTEQKELDSWLQATRR